jgi:hypothetical protein
MKNREVGEMTLYKFAVKGQMLIVLRQGLAFLLTITMSSLIIGIPFGNNWESLSVQATGQIPSPRTSVSLPVSNHGTYNYSFPFIQGLVRENEFNNTPDTNSLLTSNTSKNWKIITGNWRLAANGVQTGADYTRNPPGILLNPNLFNFSELRISSSFTINSLPPNAASYVAIVHSWMDIYNFKYSGIAIADNKTFVQFTSIRDGDTFVDPPWPGTRISDINPGDVVNMTLSLEENAEAVNVNGIEVRKNSGGNNASGYAGLLYSRVEDVIFHKFVVGNITDMEPLKSSLN